MALLDSMNALMMLGCFMMAGPVATILLLKLLSSPRKATDLLDRHPMTLLIILTAIATLGVFLFVHGSYQR